MEGFVSSRVMLTPRDQRGQLRTIGIAIHASQAWASVSRSSRCPLEPGAAPGGGSSSGLSGTQAYPKQKIAGDRLAGLAGLAGLAAPRARDSAGQPASSELQTTISSSPLCDVGRHPHTACTWAIRVVVNQRSLSLPSEFSSPSRIIDEREIRYWLCSRTRAWQISQ